MVYVFSTLFILLLKPKLFFLSATEKASKFVRKIADRLYSVVDFPWWFSIGYELLKLVKLLGGNEIFAKLLWIRNSPSDKCEKKY